MATIDINDVFAELVEENKRLNRELVFANRLLKVLLQVKYKLMNKLKNNDESGHKVLLDSDIVEFIKLEQEFVRLCQDNNEAVIEEVMQNNADFDKQILIEFIALDEEEHQRELDHVMEEDDQQNSEQEIDQQQAYLLVQINDHQGDYLDETENDEDQGDQTIVNEGGYDTTNTLVDKPMMEQDEDEDQITNHQDDQLDYLDEQIDIDKEEQSDEQMTNINSVLGHHQSYVNEIQTNNHEEESEDDDVVIIKEVCNQMMVENNSFPIAENQKSVNESLDSVIKKDSSYEVINETTLQNKNEGVNSIINKNVDSNDSKETNVDQKSFKEDKLGTVDNKIVINLDQSSRRQSEQEVHQKEEDETKPSSRISDNSIQSGIKFRENVQDNSDEDPEESEPDQTTSIATTLYNEMIRKEYNLRQSARTRPINYQEQSRNTDKRDFYTEDNEPRTPPLKSIKYGAVSTSASIPVNNNEHDNMVSKYFLCDINGCEKVFKTWTGLLYHKKTHLKYRRVDEKRIFFKCDYNKCLKIFTTQKDVTYHQQKYHQNSASFNCKYKKCGKDFGTGDGHTKRLVGQNKAKKAQVGAKNMVENSRRVMTKQSDCKQIKCNICSKSYARTYITQHMNKHTDQFKCEVLGCKYKGDRPYDLKKHVIRKHKDRHAKMESGKPSAQIIGVTVRQI